MSFTIHESDALTMERAEQIIAEHPGHEVVYVHGETVVWREQVLTHLTTPFQIIAALDAVGVPTPRIVLNMADEGGK